MKIGVFIGRFLEESVGGGATFQNSILDHIDLIAERFPTVVFYYSKNKSIPFPDIKNCEFVNLTYNKRCAKLRVSVKYLYFWLKYGNRSVRTSLKPSLDRILRGFDIDIVYFAVPNHPFVSIPHVDTVWDLGHMEAPIFPEVGSREYFFEGREDRYWHSLRSAAAIVTGNEVAKQQIVTYYGVEPTRIHTIPMITPEDMESIPSDTAILEKHGLEPQKYLFYPAQFWAHKNHLRLVEAMAKLPDMKLALSGSDKYTQSHIKAVVDKLGLNDRVVFLGFISRNEMKALYENAYALTYASLLGPDNIPPLEAMSLGCPVIASDIPGHREQLKNAALLFDPFSADAVVEQVRALEQDSLRAEKIALGNALSKTYSSRQYVLSLVQVFEKIEGYVRCWR